MDKAEIALELLKMTYLEKEVGRISVTGEGWQEKLIAERTNAISTAYNAIYDAIMKGDG